MIVGPQITIVQQPADLRLQRSFFLELGVEMLISGRHLAGFQRGDVFVRKILGPHSPAIPGAKPLVLVAETTLRGRPCLVMSTGWLSERSSTSPTAVSWNSLLALSVTVAMGVRRFRHNSTERKSMSVEAHFSCPPPLAATAEGSACWRRLRVPYPDEPDRGDQPRGRPTLGWFFLITHGHWVDPDVGHAIAEGVEPGARTPARPRRPRAAALGRSRLRLLTERR